MDDRRRYLRIALSLSAISIAWNGVAGTIAVYVALSTGGLALLGFGVDAVIDSVASVALIWRFLAEASRPERAARVEILAERVVGIALIALAVYLVVASARSLAVQAHPEPSFVGVALLLASAAALPPLAYAKNRVASRLGSGALRADSVLTAAAGLLALIGLASLALSEAFGFWWADAGAALIVAVIVFREGWAAWRPGFVRPAR